MTASELETVIARSEATKQSSSVHRSWIALQSLSSGRPKAGPVGSQYGEEGPSVLALRLDRLHVGVGQAEMVADLVDQDVADDLAKRVVVVGGANSASQAALHLAKLGCTVTMVVREENLGSGTSQYLVQRIADHENITVHGGHEITRVLGDTKMRSVAIRRVGKEDGHATEIEADGHDHTLFAHGTTTEEVEGALREAHALLRFTIDPEPDPGPVVRSSHG